MPTATDIREDIAWTLELAAGIIGHYGLCTGDHFEAYPGYEINLDDTITDGSPLAVSLTGALVLAHNITPDGGYKIPPLWMLPGPNNWTNYTAVPAFAQYLTTYGAPAGPHREATIISWFLAPGRTEGDVILTLECAAAAAADGTLPVSDGR